jgi:hypothetical protein
MKDIRVVSIEPAITIPTFLVVAPTMQKHWYSDLDQHLRDSCDVSVPSQLVRECVNVLSWSVFNC